MGEYYRSLEVDTLLGDSRKARRELNWKPKTSFLVGMNQTFDWYLNNKKYFKFLNIKDITKRLGRTLWLKKELF